MASNDKHESEAFKSESPPPPSPRDGNYFAVDFTLRVLLFAASLISLVIMVTTKETKLVIVRPGGVPFTVAAEAKFNDSPSLIYLVAAMSVTALYSILTAIASLGAISKPGFASNVLLYFALLDALLLGMVASAVGAAGGAGYIALMGNSHAGWAKICNTFSKYCWHLGSSISLSLVAAILLLLLTMLSVFSIHRRVQK